jgi:hypothetical protein
MIIEDVANWLADMPNQSLPIYPMQFPLKDDSGNPIINCIAIFPAHGKPSGRFSNSSGVTKSIDYPDIQVQVRYTDPFNAYAICEAIRVWLDLNVPTGYVRLDASRAQPDDLTSDADLSMVGSPCYRFSCNFSFIKVRT